VRDQLGLNLAPLMLRVMLAATFFWAGLGKVVTTVDLSPEQAARLANIGGPPPGAPGTSQPPVALPDPQPDPQAEPQAEAAEPQASAAFALRFVSQDAPNATSDAAADAAADPDADQGAAGVRAYVPADFPDGLSVRRLFNLALLIDAAAIPGLDDQSEPKRAIWPLALGEKPWPVALAWAAAITELVIGVTLLLGLLTRISAVQVVGIMGVAMWLTQFGAAIQSGTTQLGFLPGHAPFDTGAWMALAWQLSLFASGLALIFLGPGQASLDALLFGRGKAPARAPKRDRSNP
ncbi:MAG: DoxX family membrane protein, partial [Planctomycetota bacterium]